MKLADHQGKSLMADETSAVEQAERRSKASVEDVRGVMEAALATTRSTAKEVSDRRWTELGTNGTIGFRSGTDPEAKLEVERRVSVSHESRETINQTKQTILAHNQESHNYKPNNCKQIKRNSFELAEPRRLFTAETKLKAQMERPSKVGRIPIKIIGTDINGNKLELNVMTTPFLTEGDPILIDQTQININPHKSTQIHPNPHKSTQIHINPPKSTQININKHPGKVGVLTDRPSGTPFNIAPNQGGVNTVGPAPMTFGYGPNTFPHSAAHVLNTNHSPSSFEGEPINTIYTSAATSQNLSGFTKTHQSLKFSGTELYTFTIVKKIFGI